MSSFILYHLKLQVLNYMDHQLKYKLELDGHWEVYVFLTHLQTPNRSLDKN